MNKLKQKNYLFYSIFFTGLTLLIIYILFGKYINIPTCIFISKFNIYCPGCGCTRAFESMIRGHIWSSIKFNPSVLYFTVVLSFYSFLSFLEIIIKKELSSKVNMKALFQIGVFIMFCTCVVKNIFLFIK